MHNLVTDLAYATAMCRVHYWRRPEPLPNAGDPEGMGEYWKQHYNSPLGKGTVERFAWRYRKYVLG